MADCRIELVGVRVLCAACRGRLTAMGYGVRPLVPAK